MLGQFIKYTNFLQPLWIMVCVNCMPQSFQKSLASNFFYLEVGIVQTDCYNFHPNNLPFPEKK